jgi:hypothetical protein
MEPPVDSVNLSLEDQRLNRRHGASRPVKLGVRLSIISLSIVACKKAEQRM